MKPEVKVVSVTIEYGVTLPINVLYVKKSYYGGNKHRHLSKVGNVPIDDPAGVLSWLDIEVGNAVKKFEEDGEELDLATEIDGIGKRKRRCDDE